MTLSYSAEELRRIHEESAELIEYDGRKKTLYEWKQTQRVFERGIRAERQKANMLRAAGNNINAKDCEKRAKMYRDKYDDMCGRVKGLAAHPERMGVWGNLTKISVDKYLERDIIDVRLSDGTFSRLADNRIENVEVFAGKGSQKELRVKEYLAKNYGGIADKWQHSKGRGYVETSEGVKKAMLHWFEEESVGIKEMKVKGWSKK